MKRAAWWGLCGLMLLVGCRDFALPGLKRPGRFTVVFSWEENQRPGPDEVLWVSGTVVETAGGGQEGLASAGPERYQPGRELKFTQVEDCAACVVRVA